MKKIIYILLLVIFIPMIVNADCKESGIIKEETKYLKTITKNSDGLLNNKKSSISYEITEDEYNKANRVNNITNDSSGTTETTYKKLTVSISNNGSYYRYKATLVWKNFPTIRSYDIMAIGFYSNLKPHSNINFIQEICYSGGTCLSNNEGTRTTFNSGVGVSFALPTGSLSSLKQILYFDVEKKNSTTLVMQDAYADYAHAVRNVSSSDSKKYSVIGSSGIVLQSSVENYYDAIDPAHAVWYGTW